MGAFNQIEIYPGPGVKDENEFIVRIERLLSLSTLNSDEKKELLSAIQLVEEDDDKYFYYNKSRVSFRVGGANNLIESQMFLYYWKDQTYQFEISLCVDSESLLQLDLYPNILYKPDLILQIEKLMEQIHEQGNNELILFTDEASDGEFVNVLEGKNSSISYLFDMALIPKDVKWNYDAEKYELMGVYESHSKYRSKHSYMQTINN